MVDVVKARLQVPTAKMVGLKRGGVTQNLDLEVLSSKMDHNYIMYHTAINRILFRIICNEKHQEEKYIEINHQSDQSSFINLSDLLKDFANREVFPLKSQLFYLDPLTNRYVYADFNKKEIKLSVELIKRQQSVQSPAQYPIIHSGYVTIMYKTVSDESLANPVKTEKKRSKERLISDVIKCCKEWRRLYREVSDKKATLDDSAVVLGISRKTLEDYYLHLKNGKKLDFDFGKFKDSKVGILRNFVKQNTKKGHSSLADKVQTMKQQKKQLSKSKVQFEEEQEKQLFDLIEAQILAQESKCCPKSQSQKAELNFQEEYDIGQYLVLSSQHTNRSDSSSDSEA